MTSLKGVGVPVKLLHEAVGHTVSVREPPFPPPRCPNSFDDPLCSYPTQNTSTPAFKTLYLPPHAPTLPASPLDGRYRLSIRPSPPPCRWR